MENFIFIIYGIAVIALFTAIWAVTEVVELRNILTRKQIQNRLPSKTNNNRPKGHWD
jgi:hypothetical protein